MEDRTTGRAFAAVPPNYWTHTASDLAAALTVTVDGLTTSEAIARRAAWGPNEVDAAPAATRLRVLWRQLRSPLVLLLVFAAIASIMSGEWVDASMVGAIVAASVGVGYLREYRAESAIARLLARIELTAEVIRDGQQRTVAAHQVVPGDVIVLAAGSMVPADGVVIEASELYVDDAVLTGESFPVVKRAEPSEVGAGLRARVGCVYGGTNVRSGTARCLVVATGRDTAFGAIARRLARRAPENEFERGLRHFGLLLLVAMLVMIVVVLAVNVLIGRPPLETLLFAIALAVGLSPELLPAIVGVNLARAASELAHAGVLVRRLDAIENLGSMTVLCTDKTGTLTEGVVRVGGAYDVNGAPNRDVLALAALNARLHSGPANPIDAAILDADREPTDATKIAEIPYDFTRKRVSLVVGFGSERRLIMKGAVTSVVARCVRLASGAPLDEAARDAIEVRCRQWGDDGVRVIAVATKSVASKQRYTTDDERELGLAGFVTLFDRPKPDAGAAVAELRGAGVRVKMITGDSRYVARHVAAEVGLGGSRLVTGSELHELTDIALVRTAVDVDVFAEVDPNQKERILRALRRADEVVGFFGDGINDAPAMHAADVSLSVDTAVDVAKATADLVLTRQQLQVITRGIEQGRRTFANTLKYILTTTSANLGNMMSMAVASLVLPFLPLTAGQVLLNNFLSDIPAIGIGSDRVDRELVATPRRWSMRFITRFMLEFGLLSSAFDALTFVALTWGLGASAELFRTTWFIESLLTELVIALVVRTRRRCWRSRPSGGLLWSTIAVAVIALVMPYVPLAERIGFVAPPPLLIGMVVAIAGGYVVASELMKAWFYRA